MKAFTRSAVRWILQPSRRNAERLWLHYCLALLFVAGLILLTHMLMDRHLRRGLATAEGITLANQQVTLADSLIAEAARVSDDESESLEAYSKLLTSFAVLTRERTGRSDELGPQISVFLSTARSFVVAPVSERDAVHLKMQTQLVEGGLKEALMQAGLSAARQMHVEADGFARIHRALLLASVLVLLSEAAFIFWPAHRAVRETIAQMRQQTIDLRASQKALKKKQAELEHLVRHDPLTQLPNRAAMTQFLDRALRGGLAEGWSLFFIGLDGFKSINETYGHSAGDTLLIAVGKALRDCVDDKEMTARVGGDEFVLITDEPTAHLLKRIGDSLLDPFEINGRRIQVSASIGHLQIEDASRDASMLLADAEFALRHIKTLGGHRALRYSPTLREDQDLRELLQRDLAEAMRSGQIEPWFQPQVRLADGQLHGAEVLVRWRHPTRGLLTPNVFLPVAERAGLMVDLDHVVWDKAMDLAKKWGASGLWSPVLSLNAAPETISDPFLIERLLINLHRYNIDASQIVIEVIEDTLIDGNDDMAALNIDSLSEAGIKLELDDFGTGYGFLTKLVKLPIDGIKLDRSLISPLPDRSTDAIVRAMLALATELGLHVVAEGIEEAPQMHHLNTLGCGYGQGFGFAKPMAPDDFAAWLADHAQRPVDIPAADERKAAQA